MHVITRSEWGARAPRRPSVPMRPEQLGYFVVHCIGSKATRVAGDRRMRATQNWHMDGTTKSKRPWSDIAYSFGMDLDTNTFAGRGLEAGSFAEGKNRQGAQFNGKTISLPVQVDITDSIPQAVVDRMLELYRWVHGELGLTRKLVVMGHRQIRPKACPGDHLMHVVQSGIWTLEAPEPTYGGLTEAEWAEVAKLKAKDPDEVLPPNGIRVELARAVDAGITDGTRPNDYATRAEAAVMALRARK